ncbi:Na(+)-translocating NADH-quinone reductase subunit C [Pseudobythopirellula maris]|uniref:Na(+)-translocating NADH-quinone reductase subunit C n=1 Tax=Pseudobythopirellula maris TaxID=2527991 RepID=A0A5C5ZT70_9BACT|nr:Na(+)-translocating NADH-quinone reductase subunit C [Pseudobythopirellula maris]TWT90228.1 Na(+)-translocating NADH-quinone reductase subunit C [Pseudobythopirellula maris]
MPPRDSTIGTFMVAAILCVVCSVLVSIAAVALKPQQDRNKKLDEKKNVLLAAGLAEPSATAKEIDAIFEESIERVLIDLASGEPVDPETVDPEKYDPIEAASDEEMNVEISPAGALPGIAEREPYAFVYKIKEGDAVTGYVLPIYGKGLWSTLYGFLAVEADANTVLGITYYQHGETPGLGGEVDNYGWKSLWPGKKIYGAEGDVMLGVVKGSGSGEHQIDGLSGATITSKGVDQMIKYWLGEGGFGPYLQKQTSDEAAVVAMVGRRAG